MATLANDSEFYNESFEDLDFSFEEANHSEFHQCLFINCNFSEALFESCEFSQCQFKNSNLSLVKLNNSRLVACDFHDCKTIGIDWTLLDWTGLASATSLKFSHCILNASSFFGLSIKPLTMEHCQIKDVDFRNSDLSGADFSHSDLSESQFHHSNINQANFCDATNYSIDVQVNTIDGAKFSRQEALRLLASLNIELV